VPAQLFLWHGSYSPHLLCFPVLPCRRWRGWLSVVHRVFKGVGSVGRGPVLDRRTGYCLLSGGHRILLDHSCWLSNLGVAESALAMTSDGVHSWPMLFNPKKVEPSSLYSIVCLESGPLSLECILQCAGVSRTPWAPCHPPPFVVQWPSHVGWVPQCIQGHLIPRVVFLLFVGRAAYNHLGLLGVCCGICPVQGLWWDCARWPRQSYCQWLW